MKWYDWVIFIYSCICRFVFEFGMLVLAAIYLPTTTAFGVFIVWALYQFTSYYLKKLQNRLKKEKLQKLVDSNENLKELKEFFEKLQQLVSSRESKGGK